jgi:hypothetical protein
VKYRKGYKYQVYEDEVFITGIKKYEVHSDFIDLMPDGKLICKKGYAWDGASGGPNGCLTIDTKNSMRGSLVHDAGYQLMREGHLPLDCKVVFDGLFYLTLLHDGMNRFRAWYWYKAVLLFAKGSTLPEHDRPILQAP